MTTRLQAQKILRNEHLQNMNQVKLENKKTMFWRYQTGQTDEHLATIEVRSKHFLLFRLNNCIGKYNLCILLDLSFALVTFKGTSSRTFTLCQVELKVETV